MDKLTTTPPAEPTDEQLLALMPCQFRENLDTISLMSADFLSVEPNEIPGNMDRGAYENGKPVGVYSCDEKGQLLFNVWKNGALAAIYSCDEKGQPGRRVQPTGDPPSTAQDVPAKTELDQVEPDIDSVLALAAIIRQADGSNLKGAAALAESILSHPKIASVLQPAAPVPPADGEVAAPTDEDIMGLMPQQMHADLAAAARAMAEQTGIDSTSTRGAMRIILNRHVVDHARAVLARWGNAAAPTPPAEGEAGGFADFAAWLAREMPAGTVIGDPLWWAPRIARRAAAQLRFVQPVPVSERPWERDGWCDAEGRCWLRGKVEGDWRLLNPGNSGVPQLKYCFSDCLPAHALPLPSGEVE